MKPRIDLSEPQCLIGVVVVGLLAALLFWGIVTATTTPEERLNFYDSLGQSTNVRWR